MEPRIRDAGPDDAGALAMLFRTSFIETFGHLYKAEDLADFLSRHSVQEWSDQLVSPDYAIRLAEADGEVVAFAKLGPQKLPVETNHKALELHQIYILRQWQGKGIARPLMDWLLAEARRRGARELYLSVWTENDRARRFYERYGFHFVAPYAFMVGNQADKDEIFKLDLETLPA